MQGLHAIDEAGGAVGHGDLHLFVGPNHEWKAGEKVVKPNAAEVKK